MVINDLHVDIIIVVELNSRQNKMICIIDVLDRWFGTLGSRSFGFDITQLLWILLT